MNACSSRSPHLMAEEIARLAGVPRDEVALIENKDGSFTVKIGQAQYTGPTFDDASAWGYAAAGLIHCHCDRPG